MSSEMVYSKIVDTSIPGTAQRLPNQNCSNAMRSSANYNVWWQYRSGAIKAIMFFQCLFNNYMWDEDAPQQTLAELVVMVHQNASRNRAWMEGINTKFLKHPVTGNVRPIDIVMRLLGCCTWLGIDVKDTSLNQSAWPTALMFAAPVQSPLFHIRRRDMTESGLAHVTAWIPAILDPTFHSFDHVDIICDMSKMEFLTISFHREWIQLHMNGAPKYQIDRYCSIGQDLHRLHRHNYGTPPPEHTPTSILPTSSSSSSMQDNKQKDESPAKSYGI